MIGSGCLDLKSRVGSDREMFVMNSKMPDGTLACRLFVKVVPGAKRNEVAGLLGDRLKVRVSAPPEDGKANRAVCALLAGVLGISEKNVSVVAGPASAQKVLQIQGLDAEAVARFFVQ
jgi:uncharacterized protein